MELKLEKYTEDYLKRSTAWLSDPEIKRLTVTPDINSESQKTWFQGLKERTDYKIWGFSADNVPIGAVGLKHINYVDNCAEYWGYIGEKEYIGHGIGKWMLSQMINKGNDLGLSLIYLHVADYNERALKLYAKMGFKLKGKTGNMIYMEYKMEGAK